MAQTPLMEAYPEDLYDPSDPTDRQQIEWRGGQQQRQGSDAAAAAAAAAAPAAAEQAASPGVAGGEQPAAGEGQGQGSPPARQGSGEGAVAGGYAASATASDHTFAAHAGEPVGGTSAGGPRQLSVAAQLQKDAFLVFRALCKLSIRSSDAAPGSEVTTIRGKVRARGWACDAGCRLGVPAPAAARQCVCKCPGAQNSLLPTLPRRSHSAPACNPAARCPARS